jgi:hypothetical protein
MHRPLQRRHFGLGHYQLVYCLSVVWARLTLRALRAATLISPCAVRPYVWTLQPCSTTPVHKSEVNAQVIVIPTRSESRPLKECRLPLLT